MTKDRELADTLAPQQRGAKYQNIVCDIVVVGGGASGLAAASEAARLGAQTILLEKAERLGGMMNWCVGTVTAAGTRHQRQQGIEDTPEEHFEDLGHHAGELAPRDNLELRRILVDHAAEMMDWLSGLGIVFTGPMPDLPHRKPRMLNVVPTAESFVYHMGRECRRSGVDIRLNTAAQRLHQDGTRVAGVDAIGPDGALHRFVARKAIILATGDYSNSADLKRQLASPFLSNVDAVATTSTGDGYRMAFALGAQVINGDVVRGPILRFVPPDKRHWISRIPPSQQIARAIAWAMRVLPDRVLRPFLMKFLTTVLGPSPILFKEGAVLINKDGNRFANELGSPAQQVAVQSGKHAYIVFDHKLATQFSRWPYFVSTAPGVAYAYIDDYKRSRRDIFKKADSLGALAAEMGVPGDALTQAIDAYNNDSDRTRPPITDGPFYALGPVRAYVVFTDGGLRIRSNFEVIGADNKAIPGLYAAGSVGQGGLLLEGHGHHLDWAFISGRLAAREAARQTWAP